MGTIEKRGRCLTCASEYSGTGAKVNDCPGHFGHIELARPVFHSGFIDDVVKILRCVCFHCSRLLIDRKDHRAKHALNIKDPETRLRQLHELCRPKKRCEVTEAGEGCFSRSYKAYILVVSNIIINSFKQIKWRYL